MKTKFYFIDKPNLEEYRVEKRYYTNQANDIFIDSISHMEHMTTQMMLIIFQTTINLINMLT